MEYKFEEIGEVMKVALVGRLVAACSEEMGDLVARRIGSHTKVVFDLSEMAHIDSSGLGVLVQLLQRVKARGGAIKLAALQAHPRLVFEITKVFRLFDICDTAEQAVAAFQA